MNRYDAVVAGLGGAGSAALYHLARRGGRVLGIDRFVPGHDRGSSHGRTRVIRMAYFEHPDYVPLLRRAYANWAGLAAEAGETLYHETGVLEIGPEDGEVVRGVCASAAAHDIPIERLDAAETMRRFPGFTVPREWTAVFEPHAGLLLADAALRAHLRLAEAGGAEVRSEETVRGWRDAGGDLEIETDRGRVRAGRLVVCPGAWAMDLLGDLGVDFSVRRKTLFWHDAPAPYTETAGCPVFLYETPSGVFYGLPIGAERALKVARHSGGETVPDPFQVARDPDPEERAAVERFLAAYLPAVSRPARAAVPCLYPMSPDEHFVVGRHPADERVCYAAGLSGHGFKFTSVLGEILADLALEGATQHPIAFLSPSRATLGARA